VHAPEPVTALPARGIGPTVFHQGWHDLTFLHWPVDPARIAPLLPRGVRPDEHDGTAWIGLVPFQMVRIGLFSTPGLPYFGTFCETNVRTYSVDEQGRRGVVFLSLEASRLAPVLVGRAAALPYLWARMSIARSPGGAITYTSRRRWPGPGPTSRIALRPGEPVTAGPLEHFLTARWGLHTTSRGRTVYWPNEHRQWPLRAASLLEFDDELLAAAGFADLARVEPASALFSPGVQARFGPRVRT
jgi:uncharacterized protein YqjF (DUF2071 family)